MFSKHLRLIVKLSAIIFLGFISNQTYATDFKPFVIFDLRDKGESYHAFFNEEQLIHGGCYELIPEIIKPINHVNNLKTLINFLENKKSSNCKSSRSYGKSPVAINVFVLQDKDANPAIIEFTQKKRQSEIKKGLKTIIKIVKAFTDNAGKYSSSREDLGKKYMLTYKDFQINYERVEMVITVKVDGDEDMSYMSIAGPVEHWFMSADILIDSTSELKYNSDTQTITKKDKPTDFYVGLNYAFGDIYADEQSWTNRLFVKGMIKADSDPLESYGIGLGYRPKTFDSASFFLAYVISKEDEIINNQLSENSARSKEIRFGVSFNIDSALAWLEE